MTRSLAIEIGDLPRQSITVPHLPFHIYSFDLASLNLSLRFLKDPTATFTVGLANPTYAEKGKLFVYKGEVTFTFLGEEERESAPCRKYSVEGEGLEGRKGFVWVERDESHIVDMEIPLPNHPEWRTLKLKLLSKAQMKPEDWQKFMRSKIEGG